MDQTPQLSGESRSGCEPEFVRAYQIVEPADDKTAPLIVIMRRLKQKEIEDVACEFLRLYKVSFEGKKRLPELRDKSECRQKVAVIAELAIMFEGMLTREGRGGELQGLLESMFPGEYSAPKPSPWAGKNPVVGRCYWQPLR